MCKSELNQLELGSAYLPGKKKIVAWTKVNVYFSIM